GPRDPRLGAATGADELHVACRLESLYTRNRERAGGEVSLDRDAGDERGTEVVEHGQARRLLQSELERHIQLAGGDAELTKVVLDHLAYPAPLLHEDERLLPQLLERHRLPRPLVVAGNREHHLIPVEGLERDAAMTGGGADDAQLELSTPDLLDDGIRGGDRERDMHLRVEALELAEYDGQHASSRAGRGADL